MIITTDKKGKSLIYGDLIVKDRERLIQFRNELLQYSLKKMHSNYSNSIQIFSSLLVAPDLKEIDVVTKKMLDLGITPKAPFNNTLWEGYSKNIFTNMTNESKKENDLTKLKTIRDLVVFRQALEKGYISYEILEEKPLTAISGKKQDLEQVYINSALLLNNNYLVEKKLKNRKK